MIDWKLRALVLATVIWEGDLQQARHYAAGLRQLEDLESQTQIAFFVYWKNQDRKKAKGLFNDYLALVRLANETAERLDRMHLLTRRFENENNKSSNVI